MNEREKSKVIMIDIVTFIQKEDWDSLNNMLISTNFHSISLREALALIRGTYAIRFRLNAWQSKLNDMYQSYQHIDNIDHFFIGLHQYLK